MKRYITIMLSMLLIFSVINPSEVSAEDSIKVYIDGELITSQGTIINGSTLIPFRTIFEKLEARVEWDQSTRTVKAYKGDTYIELTVGQKIGIVNGNQIKLDTQSVIVNGSTMVPVRFVSEAFDCTVVWDGKNKTVLITTNFDINEYLHTAVLNDNLEKVVELLNDGADPNNVDYLGRSPLEWSIPLNDDDVSIAKALLEAGADPNTFSDTGNSIIHLAIMYGSVEMVKLLIEYGADLQVRSSFGDTPLDSAREKSKLHPDSEESFRQKYELIVSLLEEAELNNTSIVKIESIKDLENYYNKSYSALDTPMGIWRFEYKIDKNTSSIFRYDYWIQVDWQGCSPYEIEYSIEFSNEEKGKTIELLKNFQEDIANIAFLYFPDKKFTGGFYSSYYKYPNLKVGYNSIRFLTWVNYTNTVLLDYYEANITQFHWDSFIDDYIF